MDPDLDYNQQHWQDRLDSFQWELMSIVSQLDSVRPDRHQAARRPDRRRRRDGPLHPNRHSGVTRRRRDSLRGRRRAAAPGLPRFNPISHQRVDQRSGQRGPGLGRRPMDHVGEAGRLTAVDLAVDGRRDGHGRSGRRRHLRWPRSAGLRPISAARGGCGTAVVGTVAAPSRILTSRATRPLWRKRAGPASAQLDATVAPMARVGDAYGCCARMKSGWTGVTPTCH